MKKSALLASAASLLAVSTAFAADLPSRKVAPVAPVAPAFTWTGFYVGVNAGIDWTSRNVETTLANGVNLAVPFPELAGAGFASGLASSPYSNKRAGFIGGVQVGYNYQVSNFVIGAEADFMGMGVSKTSGTGSSYSHIESYTMDLGGGTTQIINTQTIAENTAATKVTQNWLGTVRLRAGYAVDRFLVFATGGLAYGNASIKSVGAVGAQQQILDPNGNKYPLGGGITAFAGGKTATEVGYAVGGGVEYAMTNNWLLRAEYMYYNLGNVSNTAVSSAGAVVATTKTTVDGNIVRAAISYKF